MTEPSLPSRPRFSIDRKKSRLIRLDTLEAAANVAGKALHLMVGIWSMAVLVQSPTLRLSRSIMCRVGVSRFCATDALRRLEAAGLLKVERNVGRSPVVTLLEPRTGKALNLTIS